MFRNILLFELRYQFRKPATHIFALLMLLIGLLFLGTDAVSVTGAGPLVKINSPYIITQVFLIISIIGLIILPGITGTAIIRDIEMKTHEILYTTPVGKWSYVMGRFLGTYIVSIGIYTFAIIGGIIGTLIGPSLGWVNPDKVGEMNILYYIVPHIVFIATNAFLFAAISFAIGLLFRNFIAVYVQGFALLILWTISQNFMQEIENRTIAALLDPMGFRAFSVLTEFWTPIERNTQLIGFTGEILANRLLWMSVALIIFGVSFMLFRMDLQTKGFFGNKRKKQTTKTNTNIDLAIPKTPTLVYTFSASITQCVALTRLYVRSILRERPFIAISLIGLMNFGINAYYASHSQNMDLHPVTYIMIDTIRNTFTLFAIIISTLYAGELIWKERSIKLAQTFDTLPIPLWISIASKLVALTLVLTVLTVILILGAMLTQIFQGYTTLDVGQYAQYLCMIAIPNYVLLNILALCIHVIVNQKYVGHMVVILTYIFKIVASNLGFEHSMWNYAGSYFGIYSDMNGWSPFYQRGFSYLLFFGSIGAVLSSVAYLLYIRGTEESWKVRLSQLRKRLNAPSISFASLAVVSALGSGGYIYYNTNILNTNISEKQQELRVVEYEKKYARYKMTPQPRITSLFVNCELHPYQHWYTLSGVQTLVNKEQTAIDTLIVNYNQDLTLNRLNFSQKLILTLNDTTNGIKFYRFATPLQPGESMTIDFSIGYYKRGFPNSNFNTRIIDNGTFLYTSIAPSYGYSSDAEMNDPSDRKKYGLPVKERIPNINDSRYKNVNYIDEHSDAITFEAIVSTEPDQIAIAPGYLQREWNEQTVFGKRRFFHYKMDKPIWNFAAILSGKYDVVRDVWHAPDGRNIAIEIYYHPRHNYNTKNFIESAKLGLEYYSKNFSPYQHSQYRVIEFPRYESFAQAFPNTIPFSESLEFIARQTTDPNSDNIDFGFFVNAHELAHQWWAHQVLGSNQQGCTIMSESLAEYSALRVMEKKYGAAMVQKFLRYELDGYLRGRSSESRAEQPIAYNENQQYIHYNKGSHTFYCLSDYIGEDTLNRALAEFLTQWGGKFRPYPNSRDLLTCIRSHTPDSLQNVVTDLFEKITLFSNQIRSAYSTKNTDGSYSVHVEIASKKFYADSTGNETSAQLNDWVDVGIFAPSKKGTLLDNPLYFKKHKITKDKQTLTLTVQQLPEKIGIDPFYKLVDRSPDDNVKSIEHR